MTIRAELCTCVVLTALLRRSLTGRLYLSQGTGECGRRGRARQHPTGPGRGALSRHGEPLVVSSAVVQREMLCVYAKQFWC